VVNYWFFKLPSEERSHQAMYYFRMVEPDFTPLPVYDAMREYITNLTPTLYIGVHQAEDNWAMTLPDSAEVVEVVGAQFNHVVETTQASFAASGTDVRLRWRGDAVPNLEINGRSSAPISVYIAEDGWNTMLLYQSLNPQITSVRVTSNVPFQLDSVTVYDRTATNVYPLIGGIVAVVSIGLYVVASALCARKQPARL
jgi:hypothetical protein